MDEHVNYKIFQEYRDPDYGFFVKTYIDEEHSPYDSLSEMYNDRDYTETDVSEAEVAADHEADLIREGTRVPLYVVVFDRDGKVIDRTGGLVVDADISFLDLIYAVRGWCYLHLGPASLSVPLIEWFGKFPA